MLRGSACRVAPPSVTRSRKQEIFDFTSYTLQVREAEKHSLTSVQSTRMDMGMIRDSGSHDGRVATSCSGSKACAVEEVGSSLVAVQCEVVRVL